MTDLKTTNSSNTNLTEFAVPSASGYDGAGSRLSVTATAASGQQYGVYTGTTTYAYDAGQTTASLRRSQLTGEAYTATGTGTSYTRSQGYDQATSGSASSSTGPGNPTTFRSTFRSFNSDNQDTANTYDGNGSPTGYGTKTLTYDAENRLISYGSGGTAALTCGYTPDGLRAFKQSGSATPVYYLYDGDEPVCELDTASGYVGLVKRVNTFGLTGFVSRKTINDQTGGTSGATGYYTFDLQGNAVQRLDNYGVPQVSYQTDAFGKVSSSDGSGVTYGFGGQWGYSEDSETGLVLCTHRFYDPANGRWLTRDPIDYDGGINLYGYVRNNPIGEADPLGLWSITIGIGVSGILPIIGPVGVGGTVEAGIVIGNGGVGVYGFGFGGPSIGGGVEGGGPIVGGSFDNLEPGVTSGPIAGIGGFGGAGGTLSGSYTHPTDGGGSGALGGKRGEGGGEEGGGGGVFAGPGYGGSIVFPWPKMPPYDNGTGTNPGVRGDEPPGDNGGANSCPGQYMQ